MKYFTHKEFDQKGLPGSGKEYMDPAFLSHLDDLRHKCGFPLIITSGYRSSEYNAKISRTGTDGPHTTGKAADIKIGREKAHILLTNAMQMGCFTGIGIKQKGQSRFIHLDILTGEETKPRPTVWSY